MRRLYTAVRFRSFVGGWKRREKELERNEKRKQSDLRGKPWIEKSPDFNAMWRKKNELEREYDTDSKKKQKSGTKIVTDPWLFGVTDMALWAISPSNRFETMKAKAKAETGTIRTDKLGAWIWQRKHRRVCQLLKHAQISHQKRSSENLRIIMRWWWDEVCDTILYIPFMSETKKN